MCQSQFKNQDTWKPRRADVSVWVQGQEKPNVSDQSGSPYSREDQLFLFDSCLRLIEWGPPTLRRAILHSLPIQMLTHLKLLYHRHTQICLDQVSGNPVAQSHVKSVIISSINNTWEFMREYMLHSSTWQYQYFLLLANPVGMCCYLLGFSSALFLGTTKAEHIPSFVKYLFKSFVHFP